MISTAPIELENIAEEIKPPDRVTIIGVTGYILRHPIDVLIYHWNWKAGFLSGLLRSPIFLFANLNNEHGVVWAIGLMLSQFVFRTLFGGTNGALIQAYSRVEPPWHAVLTVPLTLAVFSHLIEFSVQCLYDFSTGTTSSSKGITISILMSALSAVFNIFAMRRGALLVKDKNSKSLWKDIKSFPLISAQFIFFVPWKVYELILRRRYLVSLACTLVTSLGLGIAAWIYRGKLSWGYVVGGAALILIVILVDIIAAWHRRYIFSLSCTVFSGLCLAASAWIYRDKVPAGVIVGGSALLLIVVLATGIAIYSSLKLGQIDA